MVASGNFHTSEYKPMVIHEPKERVIYKLPYCPDRIVQHALMNVLKPILIKKFIANSYACIEGRGTHKASKKSAEYVRKYKYALKCDIRKFYPSINQNTLSEMLHRIIVDIRLIKVIDDIVYSFDGGYNCPIGNYCSQWFGNLYLTALDNFVLHDLKCGAYIRYCDDFILFSNDKKLLHCYRLKIADLLNTKLDLAFSKADVFNTKQGVDFCGYRHFKKYILLRKGTAKRLKRRFRIKMGVPRSESDWVRLRGRVASSDGVLRHCCSHNLRRAIGIDRWLAMIGGGNG